MFKKLRTIEVPHKAVYLFLAGLSLAKYAGVDETLVSVLKALSYLQMALGRDHPPKS